MLALVVGEAAEPEAAGRECLEQFKGVLVPAAIAYVNPAFGKP